MMVMNFARATYCAGVDQWYVRMGSEHGIDLMFVMQNERWAKIAARMINKSLNRDLQKAAIRKRIKRK